MNLFHRHRWEEIGRARIAPLEPLQYEYQGPAGVLVPVIDAMKERTAIHLRCTECGDVTSRILDGWVAAEQREEGAA